MGADKPENYVLLGEGAEELTVSGVQALPENRYRVSLSGTLKNGRIVLQLKNISDTAGNSSATGATEYLADINPPELLKMSPATRTALRALSEIELQFSEPVTGADNAQNYALSGEALGSLSITSAKIISGNKVRLTLAGQGGEGKISLRWQNISDRAGNLPSVQNAFFYLDTKSPVFQADLPTGITVSAVQTISVLYSEAVTGAENPQNYNISGTGAGNLGVKSVTKTKNGAYLLNLTGTPSDGDITLRIRNITDVAGNPLQDNSLNFTADVTPPRCTSLPSGEKALSRLDEIQLDFSEAVLGADQIANYSLTGDGVGDLKIARAEALAENQFRVFLTGKPRNGKITLQLGNVTDAAGNRVQNETQVFRADTIPPTFVVTPKSGALAKEFSRIDISYSKPVSGGSEVKNYILSGDGVGTLRIDRVIEKSASEYRILLTGTPRSGAIQLAVENIADLAGNTLAVNPVVYQADTVRPMLTASPLPQTPLNRLSEITLRFSKPVVGAENTANYRLSGDGIGTLKLEKIVKGDTDDYRLLFSGTAAQGDITLVWEKISDLAGNAPENTSLHYQIDLKPVEIRARPANNSKIEALSELELQFSKEISGAEDLNNYLLTGEFAESLKITAIESRGKNTYLLRLSGIASGTIQILIKNVKDPAGNGLNNNRLNYVIEIPTASQPTGDTAR